jgi:hypothetical protein
LCAHEQEIVAQAKEQTKDLWLTGCQICSMIGNSYRNNLLRNYWLSFATICSRKYKIEFLVDYHLCRRMYIIIIYKECVTSLLKVVKVTYLSYRILEIHIYCVYHVHDDKYYVYNIVMCLGSWRRRSDW